MTVRALGKEANSKSAAPFQQYSHLKRRKLGFKCTTSDCCSRKKDPPPPAKKPDTTDIKSHDDTRTHVYTHTYTHLRTIIPPPSLISSWCESYFPSSPREPFFGSYYLWTREFVKVKINTVKKNYKETETITHFHAAAISEVTSHHALRTLLGKGLQFLANFWPLSDICSVFIVVTCGR